MNDRPSYRKSTERKYVVRRLMAVGVVVGLVAVAAFAASRLRDDPPSAAPVEAAPVINLTIPEGETRAQVAERVEKEVRGSYLKATKTFKGFDPRDYGAPADTPSLEGFLFPATYELPKNPTAEDLVSRQIEAFEQNLSSIDLGYAKSKNLTEYDVVIIASMIEREVMIDKERPLAAAVIYNRLASGEPLGIDATIRYANENYDQPLLQSELDEDTPYNTRINAGLPPTPIGNPGLASLEAAAKPAKVDYTFYVVKPGTCGEHFFTADSAEFEAAQAEYQAALEAEGGSPTDCG